MTGQEGRRERVWANDRAVAETRGEIERTPLFYPAVAIVTALLLLMMAAV